MMNKDEANEKLGIVFNYKISMIIFLSLLFITILLPIILNFLHINSIIIYSLLSSFIISQLPITINNKSLRRYYKVTTFCVVFVLIYFVARYNIIF